ncbi:MAG: DUF2892 domain-containing protein [Halanaeroarchaeum sp.]
MATNVGTTDRYVRIASGALGILVGLAGFLGLWTSNTVVSAVFVIVGAVLLVTGYTRQCLLYRPLGIDTTEMDR